MFHMKHSIWCYHNASNRSQKQASSKATRQARRHARISYLIHFRYHALIEVKSISLPLASPPV